METNPQKYLDGILSEIDRKKTKGGKGIYRMSNKISNEVADYVKRYFENNPIYNVEMHKCPACTNEWDIIIRFSG